MAWVRCCGGSSAPSTPINLTSYQWDGNLYGDYYLVGQQTRVLNMANKTPKIKSTAVIQGNLCSINKSNGGKVTVEVSEDAVTWVQVLENVQQAGALVSAPLSTFSGHELFVRVTIMNTSATGQWGGNIKAIYPSSGVLQIV